MSRSCAPRTLDPDTREILRQRMLHPGARFKRALNDATRQSGSDSARAAEPFATPTFAMGEPLVGLDRSGALAADLEDDALDDVLSGGDRGVRMGVAARQASIASFDRDFDRFPGVHRITPGAS